MLDLMIQTHNSGKFLYGEGMHMVVRSRVPLRISFAGGGTDMAPYCEERGGVALNATIDKYATVSLFPTKDPTIVIESIDYDLDVKYEIDQFLAYDGHLDLIKGIINYFQSFSGFPCGFKVRVNNDAPPGSGLGSSSAVCVALVGAFQQCLNLPLTPYDVAEIAYKIERKELGITGGKQDQYAAAFGGFNFMEFTDNATIVNPLRLRKDIVYELHHSIILAYVGGSHSSLDILKEQADAVRSSREKLLRNLDDTKRLALDMKNYLVTGKLGKFGKALDLAWKLKRTFASRITNPRIDEIYEAAIEAGALGGKISGAGGGGYMFFFVDLDKRYSVVRALEKKQIQIVNYSFTEEGLHVWEIRQ